jgi:cell division protein FtsN
MVQIGAFSTSSAAETVSRQVTQDGHSAVVLSGKTLYRVQIKAGSTKNDALKLATQLRQSGFPGAFIVPPNT